MSVPHITVCVCTYRRPDLLTRLIRELNRQRTESAFTFSLVVADNDAAESARPIVEQQAPLVQYEIRYGVEPRKNIALVRNKALELAHGDFVALIDDDEFPVDQWLLKLLETCEGRQVAGVLGPVRPHFEQPPPSWLIRGGFCDRPEHPTGTEIGWAESRTGNVLLRRSLLENLAQPFSPEFGTGGEDQDFFQRMMAAGHRFVWCNEAIAYETVPPARWTRRFLIKRALLRGRNSLKHRSGRLGLILKSFVAVPVYVMTLPMAIVTGHHKFMRCLVKLCDHFGRVLTVFRLNPVREREM